MRRLPGNARAILGNFRVRWRRRDLTAGLPRCVVVVVLMLLLLAAAVFPFDEAISRWARTWPSWLIRIAGYATLVAKPGLYIYPAILGLVVLGTLSLQRLSNRTFNIVVSWIGLLYLIIFGLLFAELSSALLKSLIGRARPFVIDAEGMNTLRRFSGSRDFLSFPSAHATHIAALATMLAFTFWKWRYLFASIAFVAALTRVALLEHFPSDVLSGLALGTLCGALTALAFAKLRHVFHRGEDGSLRIKKSFRLV